MKSVTAITPQKSNLDRVNIFIDRKYEFSLDISQVVDLKVRVGNVYSDDELDDLRRESDFGKIYSRALNYCFSRPHSIREVRDYLMRRKADQKPIDVGFVGRIIDKLIEKNYLNDEVFARFWIDNHAMSKGASRKKLRFELLKKGVDKSILDTVLSDSLRSDSDEIKKVIAKKASRYDDKNKLIGYLMRQGFELDDIKSALDD
jgi:regulatory protein